MKKDFNEKLSHLRVSVENYMMRCEELQTNFRYADESIGSLKKDNDDIEKLKVSLENNIDNMKANNLDLIKQVSEFQNTIVKVESESKDSLRLKTDLENKNKIQRNREE